MDGYSVRKLVCRAVAQAVTRRLPARVRSCGICGGQNATGAGVLRVLQFPLPKIPQIAARIIIIIIIRGWYNRPIVASVIVDSIPQHSKAKKKKKKKENQFHKCKRGDQLEMWAYMGGLC
jgi:hypothetical protein